MALVRIQEMYPRLDYHLAQSCMKSALLLNIILENKKIKFIFSFICKINRTVLIIDILCLFFQTQVEPMRKHCSPPAKEQTFLRTFGRQHNVQVACLRTSRKLLSDLLFSQYISLKYPGLAMPQKEQRVRNLIRKYMI